MQGPSGRRLRLALQVGVWGVLAWRMGHVGWGEVARSLPTAPLYYVLLLAGYAALPVADTLIYSPWWHVPRRRLFWASLRKRVYNEDVVDYSGEASFVAWAEREGVDRGRAFRDVRDNNILSAAVSTAVTILMAALALGWSGVALNASTGKLAALALLPLIGLVVVLVVLRRRAFALSRREALRAGSLNAGRMVAVSALTVGMWAAAVPPVPLQLWVVLLATRLLVTRVPLVPAKDVLFVGVGVSLSASIGEAQAAIAGALIVQVAVTKALNLGVLLVSTLRERREARYADAQRSA